MALYLGKNKISANSVVRYVTMPTSIFYTDQQEVKIKLKGTGEISIVCDGYIKKTVNLLQDEYSEIKFEHVEVSNRTYEIFNINNIIELDLSNNGINKFVFTKNNNI